MAEEQYVLFEAASRELVRTTLFRMMRCTTSIMDRFRDKLKRRANKIHNVQRTRNGDVTGFSKWSSDYLNVPGATIVDMEERRCCKK